MNKHEMSLNPARYPDETQEQYKARRKRNAVLAKGYVKFTPVPKKRRGLRV
jgi:hypothetical protein